MYVCPAFCPSSDHRWVDLFLGGHFIWFYFANGDVEDLPVRAVLAAAAAVEGVRRVDRSATTATNTKKEKSDLTACVFL